MKTIKDFKQEFKLVADAGDKWGSAMEAFFECAGHMNKRGLTIPHTWQYSPGMGGDGTDPDSYWYELFIVADGFLLLSIGQLLHRYTDYLDYKGESY